MGGERLVGESDLTYAGRVGQAFIPASPIHAAFSKELLAASCYRRFAITEQGMFAVVSPDTRVGDELMLLQGGPVPFVARKHESAESAWELVGDAYVHGVMRGEAYDESRRKDVRIM